MVPYAIVIILHVGTDLECAYFECADDCGDEEGFHIGIHPEYYDHISCVGVGRLR